MTLVSSEAHAVLLRKLESIALLSDDERTAVLGLPLTVKDYRADQTILQDGDRPAACCFVVSGFVCGFKLLPSGGRQIVGFYIPGDLPDLLTLHLRAMDHSLSALARSRVAFMPHQALSELTGRQPGLAAAFWRETLIEGAIFREWLTGLGRRSPYGRIAHLICELTLKHKAVGPAEAPTFRFPFTRQELADAVGLSKVHISRILQELRSDGLIRCKRKQLWINDWEGLKAAAEFNPAYLRLRSDPVL